METQFQQCWLVVRGCSLVFQFEEQWPCGWFKRVRLAAVVTAVAPFAHGRTFQPSLAFVHFSYFLIFHDPFFKAFLVAMLEETITLARCQQVCEIVLCGSGRESLHQQAASHRREPLIFSHFRLIDQSSSHMQKWLVPVLSKSSIDITCCQPYDNPIWDKWSRALRDRHNNTHTYREAYRGTQKHTETNRGRHTETCRERESEN